MERWLMIAGAAMVIIGLPVIILGWWGAARTPYTFEQLPYLISGGLLGLALALLGGLFYFAYWITRQIQETRRQADQTREALGEIRDLLAGGVIAMSAEKAHATGNGTFVATAKGSMFHRSDCVVVAGRDDLRSVDPDKERLEPCKICEPLAVS
jgi:multisubunit Na+/H+ antiporter MnhG subunit